MFGYMGKWLFKSLIMTALMIGVSSYLLYVRTGHTPWSLLGIHSWQDVAATATPDLRMERLGNQVSKQLDSLAAGASAVMPDALTDGVTDKSQRVYRWVDARGVTHFGEQPPEGVRATAITLAPDRNLLQGAGANVDQAETGAAEVGELQKTVEQIHRQRTESIEGVGNES